VLLQNSEPKSLTWCNSTNWWGEWRWGGDDEVVWKWAM